MNWLSAPLRKVAPPTASTCKFAPDDQVWQLSLDQIEGDTGEIVGKRYAPAADAGSSTFCFDKDNVLYSKLRPYLNKVTIPDEPGIATTELIPLRPDRRLLSPQYLAYYLRSASFVNQASHHVAGAKMPRVVMDWFWEHEIPLPTPTEQQKIVDILDEADSLRRLRRRADAKAVRILPALFLRMFGDPGTNPMGWPDAKLGDLIASADYGSSTKASDSGRGLPLIRMGNVDYAGNLDLTDLKYVELGETEANRYRLHKGDILFNRTNSKELVGKTGLWDGQMDAVVASYFIRIRVDESRVRPCFVWALMNSAHMKSVLRATARGAIGQANINTIELRAFSVFEPPRELQLRFEGHWMNLRESVSLISAAGEALERLFSLLLRLAFMGQLTSEWRNIHMKELMSEMGHQSRALSLPLRSVLEARE